MAWKKGQPRNPKHRAVADAAPPPDLAVPTPTAQPPEPAPSAQLADIGAAFAQLAAAISGGTAAKEQQKQIVTAAMDQISAAIKAFPDLARETAVWDALDKIDEVRQTSSYDELPPGTIRVINQFMSEKVDWTWRHLKEPPPEYRQGGAKYGQPLPKNCVEWVYNRFIPKSEDVTWQGVKLFMPANEVYNGPRFFWDVYLNAVQSAALNRQHAEYLYNNGPPPADPGMLSPASHIVRARSDHAAVLAPNFLPGQGFGGLRRTPEQMAEIEAAGGSEGEPETATSV